MWDIIPDALDINEPGWNGHRYWISVFNPDCTVSCLLPVFLPV